MQQENEHVPEFQDHDARTWASFGRLASRWERTSGLDREEMLNELLQGYLCGEIWPVILPNLYGGHEMLAASPARPYWMKATRRFPAETFTRLDFLRAAKGYGHLHVDVEDSPFAAGYRGLIGIPVDKYDPLFIETYIEKLTPSPNAVARWCSDHGWPVPPGLSCSEIDVGAVDQDEHVESHVDPAEEAGRARYERWADEMQQLRQNGKAKTLRAAAILVAGQEMVDVSYVLREERRIRKEREEMRGK